MSVSDASEAPAAPALPITTQPPEAEAPRKVRPAIDPSIVVAIINVTPKILSLIGVGILALALFAARDWIAERVASVDVLGFKVSFIESVKEKLKAAADGKPFEEMLATRAVVRAT